MADELVIFIIVVFVFLHLFFMFRVSQEYHLNHVTSLLGLILISFTFVLTSSMVFFSKRSMALEPKTTPLRAAVDALSDSGFSFMAEAIMRTPIPPTSKSCPLTIFAPSDSAFNHSNQLLHPPLFYYHLCPLKIPLRSIATLPYGTKIQTHYYSHPLIVTTRPSHQEITLNNVPVNPIPIFHSGRIIVYAINQPFDIFFKPYPAPPPHQISLYDLECRRPNRIPAVVGDELYGKGFPVMGDFLDLQFLKFQDKTKLTVFAPAMEGETRDYLPDFKEYASLFRRHVVPCKLTSVNLWYHALTATPLPTFLKGYTISVTGSPPNFFLNGVPIERVDLYQTPHLVAHALPKMLSQSHVPLHRFSDFGLHTVAAEQSVKHQGCFVGGLRDVSDCTVLHIKQMLNGNSTVIGSNICVDWLEVDGIIFQGSVVDDIKPSQFSKDQPRKGEDFNCTALFADYHLATDALKAIGDSFMSAFLEMQLIDTGRQTRVTVLAPLEENDHKHYWLHYFLQYPQHIIGCRVTWSDLVSLEEGTELPTLSKNVDFKVVVTKSKEALLLNGVPVVYPDLYSSDTLVIHGIKSTIDPKV